MAFNRNALLTRPCFRLLFADVIDGSSRLGGH